MFKIMYLGKETHVHLSGKWIVRGIMLFVFWTAFGLGSAGLRFFHFGLPELVASIKVNLMETEILSRTALAKNKGLVDDQMAQCEAQNKQLAQIIEKKMFHRPKPGKNIGGEEPAEESPK